jgi:hypothetical protein
MGGAGVAVRSGLRRQATYDDRSLAWQVPGPGPGPWGIRQVALRRRDDQPLCVKAVGGEWEVFHDLLRYMDTTTTNPRTSLFLKSSTQSHLNEETILNLS